jgi:3-oxoadipate enol-lactonase
MSIVHCREIAVSYDDEGTGAPLLLVHGHPFDRSMWRPQLDHLVRAGHRVIAPDLRGYGETTVVPGKTPLETFAADLAALLDHLGVDRVVLVGLSMGGQLALEFHRLFPHRLNGLVLAATSPKAETATGRQNRTEMAARLLREGMAPHAREVLFKMIAPTAARPVAEHVLTMMRSTPPEGAAAALLGRAERRDHTGLLPAIRVPTLVVVGTEDEYTPVSEAELLSSRIPGAELVVIDGAAHLPNLERPDEFNAALVAFLATRAGGPDLTVTRGHR